MTELDFEALRAERNKAVKEAVTQAARKIGWREGDEPFFTTFDPNACYCDCASGGPCEHDFSGWREFEDGSGGEQVCQRCGLGAMSHSVRL